MDLLSIPDYYIKDDLTGTFTGRSQETKNTTSPISSRRSAKKYYQGIHDRFVRDDKFRRNMIEIGRTEDLCRQMDDLADEDHTHHLTPQEVDTYRSNWWIRSNKISSDTMPIRHISDFKQGLSTLRQLKEKKKLKGNYGHDAILLLVGAGKEHGGLLIPTKVTIETYPVLIDQGNLIKNVIGTSIQGMIFSNSLASLQMDRLQMTAVYCNRQGV